MPRQMSISMFALFLVLLLGACGADSSPLETETSPIDGDSATHTIGGTVSDLDGAGLVLQNNRGDDLAVSENGAFAFATALEDGSNYDVTVLQQPSELSQTCTVTGGSGSVDGADITDIQILCVTDQFSVGGIVTGLDGSGLVLQINEGGDLAVEADGTFVFPTTLEDGSDFSITVLANPNDLSQTCSVTDGAGTLAGVEITDVQVSCVTDEFVVSGTVAGLAGAGLLLQNNAGDDVAVTADGPFTFPAPLTDGTAYEVTVLTQPTELSQTCTVTDATGTLAGADVTDVHVNCVTDPFTISGMVVGLEGSGLILTNEADETLTLGADDTFTFSLVDGSDYGISVTVQPTNLSQTCSVTDAEGTGNGTLAGEDVSGLVVTCVTDEFSVGGTVTGLNGSGLVLQNHGEDDVTVTANGDFVFPALLTDGTAYEVTVLTQPTDLSQTCTIANDTGTLSGADVTNIQVTCVTDTFTVSGTVAGLDGSGLVLQKNGSDDVSVTADGDFVFSTAIEDGSAYEVTVLTQPSDLSQTCTIANGTGALAGEDVNDVQVTCVTDTFTVGGTVAGLEGSGLVLQNHGGDDVAIDADGGFVFADALMDGSTYSVTVLTHPASPDQRCDITAGAGTLSGADVTSVAVDCINVYTVGGTVAGLEGKGLTLQNNAGDDLVVEADGAFEFSTPLDEGSAYEVTILNHPFNPAQDCVLTNGSGTVSGSDATTVDITCTTPLVIREFSVSSALVSGGDTATLTWAADGADSCEITPGGIPATPTTFGTHAVTVNDATTYTLTCDSAGGPAVRDATVAVADEDWAQFSSGREHTCGVKDDGRLFCWGKGTDGRLGNNSDADSWIPTAVVEDTSGTVASDWAHVAAGDEHTCAVKTDGQLFCWGRGTSGRLGHGGTAGSWVPLREALSRSDWEEVSAGEAHSCARTLGGELYCWGHGGEGRLGNDAVANSATPVRVLEPDGEPAASDWGQLSLGAEHSCALKTTGYLYCWGRGANGRLGNNAGASSSTPVAVWESSTEAESDGWVQVSAGTRRTCGTKDTGAFYCWGARGVDDHFTPVSEAPDITNGSAISLGENHTCATRTDGSIYCWGWGFHGRLGQNNTDTRNHMDPVQVAGWASEWSDVSVGHEHACARKLDGRLLCWGNGADGRQGNDQAGQSTVPLQEFAGYNDWVQTTAGGEQTCALRGDGSLYCWGKGGRLGSGQSGASPIPVPVLGDTDWSQVSAGGERPVGTLTWSDHACAVKQDGRLFCWGDGRRGQLGIGDSAWLEYEPEQESTAAENWLQVSAGEHHTCAVKQDGSLFCWGRGNYGRLGDNATTERWDPTQEHTQAQDWAQVSAGARHTCAVKQDGSLFCWGDGRLGQLGDDQQTSSSVPVQEVTQAEDWAMVTAGGEHTCGLKTDGRLFCWGLGLYGQLGNNATTSRINAPVQEFTQAEDWAKVTAGEFHTCAMKRDGTLFCTGMGERGRLGNGELSQTEVFSQEYTETGTWGQVAAGVKHSCAVREDGGTGGRLYCWGYEGGGYGTLGIGWLPKLVWTVD